ncbi:MAG: acetate kinase [Planctomycetota bacterium]|nr:acetate kinase [Planctomycetota bacterium]
MKILVFNAGSSSIKYQLFEMCDRTVLAAGRVERIGEPSSRLIHRGRQPDGGWAERTLTQPFATHRDAMAAIDAVLQETQAYRNPAELFGIGHRLAHGGDVFREPTLIDDKFLTLVRPLNVLAPLHNPAMLMAIEIALANFPGVPQVAVFDTAFHHTLPPHAYHYAVPREWQRLYQVRRYGFHGTSMRCVAKRTAARLGRPLETLNLIVLHLGNGSSAAALRGGQSVDTSMGLTPLEGLLMGTRCGDLDPGVMFHVLRATGWSSERLESLLNKDSGLKGICGENDLRSIQQLAAAGDEPARLAIDMLAYRNKKYIGAYYAVLGRVDAIVFTGGIGENSALVRWHSCAGLQALGIVVDAAKNEACVSASGEIQSDESPVKVLVIPTDEEFEIAEQTVERLACAQRTPAEQ